MGGEYIIYYGDTTPVVYHFCQNHWEITTSSLEHLQGRCHVLFYQDINQNFSFPDLPVFYLDKVTTLPQVLAKRSSQQSLMIFCLKEKEKTTLWVLKEREYLLHRFINPTNLDKEIENTEKFLTRFNVQGKEIMTCMITLEDIMTDLRVMPKVWCQPHHPLAFAQWYAFWCYWLARVSMSVTGLLGVLGLWMSSELIKVHQECQDLKRQVVDISPVPEKAHLFSVYRSLKKQNPEINKVIAPLKKVVIDHWISDEMEWDEKQLKIRFQIHPDFVSEIPQRQNQINKLYSKSLKWDQQDGYPTLVHLLIPLS